MAGKVFISYSRRDNGASDTKRKVGLVTTLHQSLVDALNARPEISIDLWLDFIRVEHSNQFETELLEALEQAQFLLVVCSQSWLKKRLEADRNWCEWELNKFADAWRARGEPEKQIQERIVVIWKEATKRDDLPALITGQTGRFLFDKDIQPGDLRNPSFYDIDLGEPVERYRSDWFKQIGGLADELGRKAKAIGLQKIGEPSIEVPTFPRKGVPWNGRTIYVAHCGADMDNSRGRVIRELTGAGYKVLPPEGKGPALTEDAFLKALTEDLDACEASIHLLGESLGHWPDASPARVTSGRSVGRFMARSISRIQLEETRQRANDAEASGCPVFRRFIWAPKLAPGAPSDATPRDYDDVLRKHLEFEPTTEVAERAMQAKSDVLMSDTLSNFIIDLKNDVKRARTGRAPVLGAIKKGKLYLDCHKIDAAALRTVARSLKGHIGIKRHAVEGGEEEIDDFRRHHLKSCIGVVVCWEKASEVWVRTRLDGLAEWGTFGRRGDFMCRVVVALPPETEPKADFISDSDEKDNETDNMWVIDATSPDLPLTSEAFQSLLEHIKQGDARFIGGGD